jgi:hypothetical protein
LAFAKETAKNMKTEKDLSDFSRMLKKVTVEAALDVLTPLMLSNAFSPCIN